MAASGRQTVRCALCSRMLLPSCTCSFSGLAALQKVSAAGMPFVFVTNGGGGLTEAVYGSHLKDKVLAAGQTTGTAGSLALPEAKRMVLSYTPWESQLVPEYVNKKVLLVGDPKEKVLEVAHAYGLKNVIHYSDYAVQNPTVNPFRQVGAHGTTLLNSQLTLSWVLSQAMEAGTSHTAVANKTEGVPIGGRKGPASGEVKGPPSYAERAAAEAADPFTAVPPLPSPPASSPHPVRSSTLADSKLPSCSSHSHPTLARATHPSQTLLRGIPTKQHHP